jgi:hypothetical protein
MLNLENLPTPAEALAIQNPAVQRAFRLWLYGLVSWEQALLSALVDLAKEHAAHDPVPASP